MPFQIALHGSREGVSREIKQAKAQPEGSDQSQIDACKAFLLAEIQSIPPEFNGVRVDVNGDAHKGGRSVQISIIPQKLNI